MKCYEFSEQVEELLDELLDAPVTEAMHAHVAECRDCLKEYQRAQRFRRLLMGKGRESLEAWGARNVTQLVTLQAARENREEQIRRARTVPAAAASSGETPTPAGRPPVAFVGMRRWLPAVGSAAATAAAAVLFIALSGVFGPAGPRTLEAGQPVVLARGERAQPSEGREVQADGEVRLELMAGSDGTKLRLDQGKLMVRVEPGHPFHVQTVRGTASALGTTFEVAAREDGAVSVTVLSGRVGFDDGAEQRVLLAGHILVAPAEGEISVVSNEYIERLQLDRELAINELLAERGQRQRAEEALATLRSGLRPTAEPTGTGRVPFAVLDGMPWGDLGPAAAQLVAMRLGEANAAEAHPGASSVFLQRSDLIQEVTGERDARAGLWHPDIMFRLAGPFFTALAPRAGAEEIGGAVAATRSAANMSVARLSEDSTPAEVTASRLEFVRAVVQAVRTHIGEREAARVGYGNPVVPALADVTVLELEESTAADIANLLAKHFDLNDEQRSALRPVVDRYLAAVLAAQEEVRTRYGDVAASVLTGSTALRKGARFPESPALDSERVDRVLADLDVRLALNRPRIGLERDVHELLRPDQRVRPFPGPRGLCAYR